MAACTSHIPTYNAVMVRTQDGLYVLGVFACLGVGLAGRQGQQQGLQRCHRKLNI
jgi:hypothetical protein